MARSRNIKPGFFKNEDLAELSFETRLLFIGLWTVADREGRLEDRPKRIRVELFPYDNVDVESMINDLENSGFLFRYRASNKDYLQINNFIKHQNPHYREVASEIPPPSGKEDKIVAKNITRTQRARILERDNYTCQHCGATEQLCIDHVLPVSRGGTSDDDNLQALCMSCNTRKGNSLSVDDNASTVERRPDVDPKQVQVVPLIPDSLNSDSLSLDSLIPDSFKPPIVPLKTPKPFRSKKQQDQFDQFWQQYPRKKSKGQAEKAWAKINPDEQLHEAILNGLERAKTSGDWQKNNGEFILHPATWLNAKGWEDEHEEAIPNGINRGKSEKGNDYERNFIRAPGT